MVRLARVRGAVPALVRVTVWAGLVVQTSWSAKLRLVGARPTAGAAGSTPVPERGTVWGLSGASSVTVRLPLWGPGAVGVKVIAMEQEAPAARVAGSRGQSWV